MAQWIITSSVLIVIVIALRTLLKGHISLRLQYGLWALVLVRLLIPLSIPSNISVMNALPETETEVLQTPLGYVGYELPDLAKPELPQLPQTGEETPQPPAQINPPVQVTPPVQSTPTISTMEQYQQALEQYEQEIEKAKAETGIAVTPKTILTVIWVAGMALTAGCLLFCNAHFALRLKRSRVKCDTAAPLPVYTSAYVSTPCLFGLFRPNIYLTPNLTEDSTKAHVLTHELTHYRHKDHIWSVLRCLCLALHWYNPLVWVAASLSKKDGELACDEATIRTLGEDQRADYGRTLIGMTQVKKDSKSLFITATTMVSGKKTLKERIVMIAKHPKTAIITLIAVILVAGVAVGCTFTGIQNTAPSKTPDTGNPPEVSVSNNYLLNVNGKLYTGNKLYSETTTETLPGGFSAIGTVAKQLSGGEPTEAFHATLLTEGKTVYANPSDDRYVFCDFSDSGITKYILLVREDLAPETQSMPLSFLNTLIWMRSMQNKSVTVEDFAPYGLITMEAGSYRYSYTLENHPLTLYVTYDQTGCSSVWLSHLPDQLISGTTLDVLTCSYRDFIQFLPTPEEEDRITVEQIKQIVAEKGENICYEDFLSFVPYAIPTSGRYYVAYLVQGDYLLLFHDTPYEITETSFYINGDYENGIDIRTDDIDAYVANYAISPYRKPAYISTNIHWVFVNGQLYSDLSILAINSYEKQGWKYIGNLTESPTDIPNEHLQGKGIPLYRDVGIYTLPNDDRFILVDMSGGTKQEYRILTRHDLILKPSQLTLQDLVVLIRDKGNNITAEDFIQYGLSDLSNVKHTWNIPPYNGRGILLNIDGPNSITIYSNRTEYDLQTCSKETLLKFINNAAWDAIG